MLIYIIASIYNYISIYTSILGAICDGSFSVGIHNKITVKNVAKPNAIQAILFCIFIPIMKITSVINQVIKSIKRPSPILPIVIP